MLYQNSIDYCQFSTTEKPKLIVVIDTEEEFDWSADFSRDHTSVQTLKFISRVQDVFDAYQITPVYVIDYPVVSQADGYRPLQEIYADGRCLIGAHVHPWVNPPFEEQVSVYNSFPGNLPRHLEAAKIRILSETIGERFGAYPVIYKAGRYGIGVNTADIIEEQGFEIDLSVCPHMDYSDEGGPDFTYYSAWPYWFGRRRLLEIPVTAGYSGWCRKWGQKLHNIASNTALIKLRSVGILARLKIVNKVRLSPEGFRPKETIEMLNALYKDGLRVFSLAFHSPSIVPGHTPYVRSQRDLDQFLAYCREIFEFFIEKLGGYPTTPLELKAQLLQSAPQHKMEDI